MTRNSFRSLVIFFLALSYILPVSAQTRRTPRAKTSRTSPSAIKQSPVTPFTLVNPVVQPGQSAAGRFPAADPAGVPAHVFHGGRPGPVVAFLFYGFEDEAAFHEAAEATFGAVPRASMQGTLLVLSFPSRRICDGGKPCAPEAESVWMRLAPEILKATRFVVDVHQGASGVGAAPYAFVYLPQDDRRLATYVKAMARASLIPNVVELQESELEPLGLTAAALEHLAPQSLSLNHPAIALEVATIAGEAGAPLRKGLVNLLDHLKMTSGSVSWQNRVKEHALADLPPDFFASKR